jgi:hypothetical protein
MEINVNKIVDKWDRAIVLDSKLNDILTCSIERGRLYEWECKK